MQPKDLTVGRLFREKTVLKSTEYWPLARRRRPACTPEEDQKKEGVWGETGRMPGEAERASVVG